MFEYQYYYLSSGEQVFYLRLRIALLQHAEMIPFQELSADSVNHVVKSFLTDQPEYFWFEGRWSLVQRGGISYFQPHYTVDKAAAAVM